MLMAFSGANHLQVGVLGEVGVAGVVESVGEGQPGGAGELARRRLDDERPADKL
jgi:hypothetical protein